MIKELLIASNNRRKIDEISLILSGKPYKVLGLKDLGFDDDIPETGATLRENAAIKAHYLFDRLLKNVVSEDTGLFVKALNNQPGIHTARYAGPERNNENNINLLLENLKGASDRSAFFMTVLCLIHSGNEYVYEGRIEGKIADRPSGQGGFGYDPVFIPNGHDRTFAELNEDLKSKISHRALAVNSLVRFLESMEKESSA